MARFTRTFTAAPGDIDELGHVNNTVWVGWIQDIAVAHWSAVASAADQAALIWVVTRHEIDYRGNIRAGDSVTAETWVAEMPRGARFDRHVRFTGADGKPLVEAKTSWALIDRTSGRLIRVPRALAEQFVGGAADA
ncbi:acyl-CoA thioesterase [Sphingomonas sp. RS6]